MVHAVPWPRPPRLGSIGPVAWWLPLGPNNKAENRGMGNARKTERAEKRGGGRKKRKGKKGGEFRENKGITKNVRKKEQNESGSQGTSF